MLKKFFKNRDSRLLLLFLIVTIETLLLYIIGVNIHREMIRKSNYPLALAEILTVATYGLFYRVIKSLLQKRLPGIDRFLSQKRSTPYIAAFVILLIIAVIFSLGPYNFFVKQVSNVAFFMLLTAVVCEFFSAMKEYHGRR